MLKWWRFLKRRTAFFFKKGGKKFLLVIDVQNDFAYGALGNEDAINALPFIKKTIEQYEKQGYIVVFTMDTHPGKKKYLKTHEGKYLPIPHCQKNHEGWELCDNLLTPDSVIIRKHTFGYRFWRLILGCRVKEIALLGFDTDICDVSNALCLRMLYPEADIKVLAKCCAGTSKEAHEAALLVMRNNHIDTV